MEKQELLTQITRMAARGQLTEDDVTQAVRRANMEKDARGMRVGIADVLYGIGALIVLIGISILVFDNWDALPAVTRVMVTLGSGIASYLTALFLLRDGRTGNLPRAFMLLSAVLMTIGMYVTLYEAGFDVNTNATHSIVSAILSAVFLASYAVVKDDLYMGFGVFFATWFYFAFISLIIGDTPFIDRWRFHAYKVLVMGVTYLALGHASEQRKPNYTGVMYIIGTLAFLAAALALGGWAPEQAIFWELTYPAYIAGAIYLSVRVRRRSVLVLAAFFLMLYILKLTAEYFSDSLGWATSLVLVGFLLIGIGYMAYAINRKYLKAQ